MSKQVLVMGAVAYAPKVVTIWEGFKAWFREHGLEFDFILYSNYERQVKDQFNGTLDVAWNSPLAWVRAERIAKAYGYDQVVIIARAVGDHGVGRLGEEERRLTRRVRTHLARMGRIVAPDAVNPTDGKHLIAAHHGQHHLRHRERHAR